LNHQSTRDVEILALSANRDFIFSYISYFENIFACGYVRGGFVKAKLAKISTP